MMIHKIATDFLGKLLEVQKRRTVEKTFLEKFEADFNITTHAKRVDLYNRLMEIVRSLPENIFINASAREQILDDLQV